MQYNIGLVCVCVWNTGLDKDACFCAPAYIEADELAQSAELIICIAAALVVCKADGRKILHFAVYLCDRCRNCVFTVARERCVHFCAVCCICRISDDVDITVPSHFKLRSCAVEKRCDITELDIVCVVAVFILESVSFKSYRRAVKTYDLCGSISEVLDFSDRRSDRLSGVFAQCEINLFSGRAHKSDRL